MQPVARTAFRLYQTGWRVLKPLDLKYPIAFRLLAIIGEMQYDRMIRSFASLTASASSSNTEHYDDAVYHFFQDAWRT